LLGNYRGSKEDLSRLISTISSIPETLLRQEADLYDFTVARRMSWAATRETTRVEDLAYCLLGIFNVNMSLIYGEGMKAFARLQTTILQTTADLSIFAWADDRIDCPEYMGMLAESPRQFARCGDIEVTPGDSVYANFVIITRGIQTEASLLEIRGYQGEAMTLILDTLCYAGGNMLGVCVRKIGGSLYARCKPGSRVMLGQSPIESRQLGFFPTLVEPLTLITRLPSRYPFHAGLDPVVGNRWSALRINWGPLIDRGSIALPRSHWDAHDDVFFSSNNRTKGWCASFIDAWIPSTASPEHTQDLKLLLACFQWNQATPLVLLADITQLDTATRMALTPHLENIKFESSRRAELFLRDVFESKLSHEMVATGAGLVAYLRDPRSPVTVNLRKELRPDICARPISVLDFTLNSRTTMAHIHEIPAAEKSTVGNPLGKPSQPPQRQLGWRPLWQWLRR
jgi:hypothetical protein